MEPAASNILSVDSLQIGYGSGRGKRILLPPLSTRARKGEMIAIIGRNGIGKSTLLRSIIGLQPVYGGTVMIEGENIAEIPRSGLARKAGYISTEIIRVSNMTVFELVALGRFPHTNWIGRIDDRSREAIEEAITKTGLNKLSNRYITELSDGERQRVMIARVLAQDADIMVMDEPTAFLDLPGKYEIMNLIRDLTRSGKTVIFSTHDINIALRLTDRIWLLLSDRLIEGSPAELLKNGSFDSLFGPEQHGKERSDFRDYLKNFL